MIRGPLNIEIFVIDDNPDMTECIKIIFDNAGIKNYRLFNDPDTLLEALNDDVHICVVDYLLDHDLNGLDLIKRIVKKNRHCWFIMLSGQTDFHVVVEYLNSVYGSRYIEKSSHVPLSVSLVSHVKEIVEQIYFIDDFYFNAKRIQDSFNDLKNLLTTP